MFDIIFVNLFYLNILSNVCFLVISLVCSCFACVVYIRIPSLGILYLAYFVISYSIFRLGLFFGYISQSANSILDRETNTRFLIALNNYELSKKMFAFDQIVSQISLFTIRFTKRNVCLHDVCVTGV